MDNDRRSYLAEACGTFLFVFFTAGVVCTMHLTGEPRLDVMGLALASGAALAVALTASSQVSPGCLNPAVTVALWVFRRIAGHRAVALIFMQILGAVLAGLVLRFCFDDTVLIAAHGGAPHLTNALAGQGVPSLLSGIGIELVLTCLLTIAIFATLFDPRSPKMGGLGAGLAQVAVVLFGFRLTGGSANPARWLGTVIWQTTLPGSNTAFTDHAPFWAGPVLGALLGGLLYNAVFVPAETKK